MSDQLFPPTDEPESPLERAESGDGGNRTHARFPPTETLEPWTQAGFVPEGFNAAGLGPVEPGPELRARCECTGPCAFCGRELHGHHEHDHFPIPARHSGKQTVPACRDCHDLKDRLNVWSLSAILNAIQGCGTPTARIMLAKQCATIQDQAAEIRTLRAQLEDARG